MIPFLFCFAVRGMCEHFGVSFQRERSSNFAFEDAVLLLQVLGVLMRKRGGENFVEK